MSRRIAALAALALPVAACSLLPHSYHVSSQSMEPTLMPGQSIIGWPVKPADLRRGMIVVYARGDQQWLHRIAGLPGDEIAVANGIVSINGVRVAQQPSGATVQLETGLGRVFHERFPGEANAHRILDAGPTAGDDFAPERVKPGFVFVLGDNRDNAADSRFPVEGAGQVPLDRVHYEVKVNGAG